MNICAGIVTYNPDLEKLKRNLDHILPQVEKVFLCDNGSKNLAEIVQLLEDYPQTKLFPFSTNKGIAAALNQLCKMALKEEYQWILTLDQDSACTDGLVESLANTVSDTVAIAAPQILYRNNEEFCKPMEKPCQKVEWVITSASLTNLAVWKVIGGFDEQLFIDKVDYDYCIRANKHGYKILQVRDAVLYHELGELNCRSILGKTIYVTNHSPFRRYYMSRNALYTAKKFHEGHPVGYIAKNIFKILLFEDQKAAKLKAIYHGYKDGRHMSVPAM